MFCVCYLYDANYWENVASLKTAAYSVKLKELKFFVQHYYISFLFKIKAYWFLKHIMIMITEFVQSVKH